MFVITVRGAENRQENKQEGDTGGGGRKQEKQTKLMVNSDLNHSP